jgi:SAM-dependent methyltransferase
MKRGRTSGLVPPGDLIATAPESFPLGRSCVDYFVDQCGLRSDEDVLEVGSGGGRVAIPLADYLIDGSYEGFDVSAREVEWCRENLTPRAPNFNFQHVDILNATYNPCGAIKPTEFRFPFRDESFDFVYLTSIFTHMFPTDVDHYFGEIARVLRPRGRWLATWFLLDEEVLDLVRERKSRYAFDHDCGDYRVVDPDRPENAIAYPATWVFGLYSRFGFDCSIARGRWSGRAADPGNTIGQDIVVARPRA